MGFTQRQAGGKFTADEASELIDQLQAAQYAADQAKAVKPSGKLLAEQPPDETAAPAEPMTEAERVLRTASTKSLVLEVRRRGWTVTRPK
jgi:hypothetical protein